MVLIVANCILFLFLGKQVRDVQWMDTRFRETDRFVTNAVKEKYSIYNAGASIMTKTVTGRASFVTLRSVVSPNN